MARGVAHRRLRTSHAFHSSMMTGAAEQLRALVAGLSPSRPAVPFASNLTGTWITDDQATDPNYWARHTTEPVRFADGIDTVLRDGRYMLLETGPGRTLSSLARRCGGRDAVVVASMRHPTSPDSDAVAIAGAAGELWSHGAPIAWARFQADRPRRRVPLPSYPFEGRRYWLTAGEELCFEIDDSEPERTRHPAQTLAGEVQQAIAAAWEELLGVGGIGAGDSFFGLGGHSLLGIRVAKRLSELFGVEVTLRDLFAAPTLAELAELVEVLRWAGGEGRAARPATEADNHEEGSL
jgi:acyl transferase domain-containing protein